MGLLIWDKRSTTHSGVSYGGTLWSMVNVPHRHHQMGLPLVCKDGTDVKYTWQDTGGIKKGQI